MSKDAETMRPCPLCEQCEGCGGTRRARCTASGCLPHCVDCTACEVCGLCGGSHLVSHAIRVAWIEDQKPPPEAA